MSVEFRLPEVGEGVEKVEVARWLVQEGERVHELDPIVEVQTDKALIELASPASGYITEIRVPTGGLAYTDEVLAIIDADLNFSRPTSGTADVRDIQSGDVAGSDEAITGEPDDRSTPREEGVLKEFTPGVQPIYQPKATPAVRNYAWKLGVPLEEVQGSGPSGRILKVDVERYIERRRAVENARKVPFYTADVDSLYGRTVLRQIDREPLRPVLDDADVPDEDSVSRPLYAAPKPTVQEAGVRSPTRIPFRGVRRATAEHVKRSAFTAPHVTVFDECDASKLVALRSQWNHLLELGGQRLSYLPFIVKATVSGLKSFPYFNARLNEQEQEIELLPEYHIGIAVDTPDGLLVPVIHNADGLSVREIGEEIFRLSSGARDRTLSQEDLRGSTFSLTNLGPIGSLFVTPILNYPEVGILAIHPIQRKPVVRGDELAIADVMNVSLSFDHRVIDGATSVRFVNHVKNLIENPELLMLDLR